MLASHEDVLRGSPRVPSSLTSAEMSGIRRRPITAHFQIWYVYVNSSDLELYKLSFSRFGAKLWNEIPCNIRQLPKNKFKKTLRKLLLDIQNSEDDYIDMPTLIKKVKLAKNVEK